MTQACSKNVSESCNCAAAIMSGDDVIVLNGCATKPKYPKANNFKRMSVTLYLNGKLTPGTKIYKVGDGQKYSVSTLHGV